MADAAIAVHAAMTLWRREVVRFLRQRSRIIGALASPIVFWALIGFGLHKSFRPVGSEVEVDYLTYFFPGTIVMILLFTVIFSTFSVIEDRKEGFLQSVLISPAPRASIVAGKILGGATLAWLQGMMFCLFAPMVGLSLSFGAVIGLAVVLFVAGAALTGLGFLLAWPMESTQGFHAIMNLLLLPMWFLSGAMFPISGAHPVMQWVMRLNPVTYAVAAVQWMVYEDVAAITGEAPPGFWVSMLVVVVFGAAMWLGSTILVNRTR